MTPPKSLLIRADASLSIGNGHVMRCLALAQAWHDVGGAVSFAAAEMSETLRERIISEGMLVSKIEAVPGSEADAALIVAEARRLNPGWIVVDGDHFGDDFLSLVRLPDIRVLLIDDFGKRSHCSVDLIVNPNIGGDEERYCEEVAPVQTLAGASYILLRREFQLRPQAPVKEAGLRVLVTLGGTDPENMTQRIVRALSCCPDIMLTVVAGPGCPWAEALLQLKTGKVQVVTNPRNIAELMVDADLAVISAGGTLWELLAVGCPVLSYWRNAVQMEIVQTLEKRGVIVDLGSAACFGSEHLISAVKSLAESPSRRHRMRSVGRELVDGLGSARVAAALRRCEG